MSPINYGRPPDFDEIEVTLFGPGYGEAVAVHLGEGSWILVDSCIDPSAKASASGCYLDQLGVDSAAVKVILASHWHDDHVRGISELAKKFPSAEFALSAIFNKSEAQAFLAAFGGSAAGKLTKGTKELFAVIEDRDSCAPTMHKTIVFEAELNGRRVAVTALSPLPHAHAQSIAYLAQFLPNSGSAINNAPELRPNFEAVSLHIDFGDDAVLLGADLEEHDALGWSAIVAHAWSGSRRPASAYKVAHHGSVTGHCTGVWGTLLQDYSVACMTPFTLGRQRLPTADDISRIKSHTPDAYVTSVGSVKAEMDDRILKRLKSICVSVTRADSSFGAIRLRRKIGAPEWSKELFGAAKKL